MRLSLLCIFLVMVQPAFSQEVFNFYPANNPNIQYTGRIDFTDPALPRFWQPGVYINARFLGTACEIILEDEVLWGTHHNYIEVVVDGVATRLQLKSKRDTIRVAEGLQDGMHSLQICKNTEASAGYLELVGIRCKLLVKPEDKPIRKIECIGNAVTCGTGADFTAIPCGEGNVHDQQNAYRSYGALTARALDAQYHLSAVSGIGLMNSCCKMDIIMPQVFNKVNMRNDTIRWNFEKYTPDVVTVCLGDNDGIQDTEIFVQNYVSFLHRLRNYYPKASIVCMSSPMADEALRNFMKDALDKIVIKLHRSGDKLIYKYIFEKQYKNGCDGHPDLREHQEIANLLTTFIQRKMNW